MYTYINILNTRNICTHTYTHICIHTLDDANIFVGFCKHSNSKIIRRLHKYPEKRSDVEKQAADPISGLPFE
jgi:hypothetical protein